MAGNHRLGSSTCAGLTPFGLSNLWGVSLTGLNSYDIESDFQCLMKSYQKINEMNGRFRGKF